MLQALNLNMNKSTTNLSRVEVRDSDKGEILESFILNSDGTPYDLSGKSLVFNENKDGDKFVSDPNVTIVDARIGHITYQLHDQVHSAPGTAWFDIIQNGAKIDSTTDFYIEVRDGLKCTVYNTTYISDLEKLKQQMEALIRQADGELKAELQRAEQQLNQELQNFRNQYGALSNDFQNHFKAAQNARQQDYNNQKNAINADWTNTKNQIWGQWNSDKASIDKQAQDTVQAIKDNAKQVLDKDQADWNAKQASWNDTFSRIVKEWQVKTNSLNSTVQDLTTKFGNIINELADLMNNRLPNMDSKTNAVQAKINELKASLGQIDWTSFAKDLETKKLIYWSESGWWKLNSNMTQWWHSNEMVKAANVSYDEITNMSSFDYTGVSGVEFSKIAVNGLNTNTYYRLFFEWENLKQLTKIAGNDYKFGVTVYEQSNPNNVLASLDLPVEPCNKQLFQLSFDTNNVSNIFIELNTGGLNDGLHFQWKIGNWRLKIVQDHVPIVAIKNNTDLNTIKTPGMYHAMGTDGIANSPIPAWFDLTVNSDNMYNGTQMLHAENENQVYVRSWHNGNTFTDWQRITNATDLATRLPVSGGNMNKGSWITWSGSNANSANDGNIGGLQWNGATDNIQIYGNNNRADNLDLVIKLGDDNSNRISFRDKDGAERAAITADGHFTGGTDWAHIGGTGLNNPTLGRYIQHSNTWNDIIGQNNGQMALTAIRDDSNGSENTIGQHSAGVAFGGGDTKGVLSVAWDKPQARIIGGNGNAPTWHKDIAWKDDAKVQVVRDYNIETEQPGPRTIENANNPWLVDQVTLATFARAHRDVRNHTDFRYPTDQAWNTAINLNSDPYLDTGIYKIGNCAIINGPWSDVDTRRWLFLQVAKYDDNSIYQTINYGNGELYSRCVSKTTNSYPGWVQFATMERVAQNVSSVSGNLQAFIMDQLKVNKRVDYSSPTGTVTNETVNFNDYRETGILKVVNCLIQNGPYRSDYRHTVFLKITNLDGQTQYQTVYEGDNLYGRKLYNGSGQWHKYTNTPI
ncbi:BppU family phage baseplate upper protein [Lactobacillus taiwanensis]|uniref:BppU family phage baseplate upper protein n=1 Tax=Lactobacillus taiwanensis TaxID=508451 RepID=UPI00242DE39A|nr:BppU family phage baseplate upper protein [Lactobacillus taiwanensis]